MTNVIAPDDTTEIHSANDPRGREYGMFLVFRRFNGEWTVAHTMDNYSMSFPDTLNFDNWVRAVGVQLVRQ